MSQPVSLVFPRADTAGGVERVVWDTLQHYGRQAPTRFVGVSMQTPSPAGVRHVEVSPRTTAYGLRGFSFRSAARAALLRESDSRVMTFGVQCPPGEVLWVGSVHRAWLEAARTLPLGPVQAPASIRFAMPHHRALLALERSYFTRQQAAAILCTSERERDDLVRLYGVDASLTTVVPNGFDPEVFSPGARTRRRAEERARLGLHDGDLALLFVANELPRKGFGQVLDALARLRHPRLSLHLVGRTAPTAYERTVRDLGLQDVLRYHGPTTDVAAYHAACDLLLLPSQYEPFGLVVVEALASGLPVITTRVTGASAAVGHDKVGLILEDAYDVDELAGAVERALDDTVRQRWSLAAPAAAAPYAWPSVFARVDRLLAG